MVVCFRTACAVYPVCHAMTAGIGSNPQWISSSVSKWQTTSLTVIFRKWTKIHEGKSGEWLRT